MLYSPRFLSSKINLPENNYSFFSSFGTTNKAKEFRSAKNMDFFRPRIPYSNHYSNGFGFKRFLSAKTGIQFSLNGPQKSNTLLPEEGINKTISFTRFSCYIELPERGPLTEVQVIPSLLSGKPIANKNESYSAVPSTTVFPLIDLMFS